MNISKSKLNLTIDIIMFIVLMAIAGIGFMIKYVLVPGAVRNEMYGRGTELYFFNLDRHQWGSIHLYLGFVMFFLLVLHIIFHWNMIGCIFKRMVEKKKHRLWWTMVLIGLIIILVVLPLFVKPEVRKAEPHGRFQQGNEMSLHPGENQMKDRNEPRHPQSGQTGNQKSLPSGPEENNGNQGKSEQESHELSNEIPIKGYMTLNEAAATYHVSAGELASHIKVPLNRKNEKLGRLRKEYGFHLSDVREFIADKKNK